MFSDEIAVEKLGHDGTAESWSHRGAAAWFAGIENGRCLFGASAGKLDAPDVLASGTD